MEERVLKVSVLLQSRDISRQRSKPQITPVLGRNLWLSAVKLHDAFI